ncbi:MAG: hypothetical protein Q8L97_02620 [Nitrosomonas sp.]|uniref:hypothetical protein n=1 Tax=Nitrosomonas sp. TaxID=42353 RepID=UPI002730F3FD|nr:hypothetical protein [Nitrosomonas sp.]MDP1549043.1 hypothetical protein [Nitrosomonas sp.]
MIAFGQFVLGTSLGYLLFSIAESIVHKYFLHAKWQTRKYWPKLGYLGTYLQNSWYSHHVVHHHSTFKSNHVTLFDSEHQRRELNQLLTENGKNSIIFSNYGLRVGNIFEKIKYLCPHLPWIIAACYFGGGWFTLGLFVPLCFYIWIAEYAHPYLHFPYNLAIDSASTLMRLVLRTKYFRFLTQHHYLHHKYINCNFNLLLGADWLLGYHQSPNEKEFIEIKKLGL